MIDNKKLNKSAYQNPSTSNPSISESQIKIINAFTASKKRPNVRIVIGRVSIINSGLTNILSNAKSAATTKEVRKPSTATPGSILESITTNMAVTVS